MLEKKFKYIYGPVFSWRLGISLGIDLLGGGRKICNFNCVYCQLGRTPCITNKRVVYVPEDEIIQELKNLPKLNIDYITFSGSGEPTLAKNLGIIISFIKKNFKIPIAILTNSSFLGNSYVMEDLSSVDLLCAKLDVSNDILLNKINQPVRSISFKKIYSGLLKFRKNFKNKFSLQIMFIEENKEEASQLAELSYEIMPEEIQINTPLRPSEVKPLSKEKILKIKDIFLKRFQDSPCVRIISVYEQRIKRSIKPFSEESTSLRRPILC